MEEKKLYTHKRWTEPMAYRVVGYREITEEEKEMVRQYEEKLKKRREKD